MLKKQRNKLQIWS